MQAAPILDLSAIPAVRARGGFGVDGTGGRADGHHPAARASDRRIEPGPAWAGRLEKPTGDERQLAFADLSIALAEVEAEQETRAAKSGDRATRPVPKRTIGNLPPGLPRFEVVIEPDSPICPCGCGVAIAARTDGATMATAQDRRGPHGPAGHRPRTTARDRHRAPEVRAGMPSVRMTARTPAGFAPTG